MIEGKNKWCGPAVVAALLKTDTDVAAKAIRIISKQHFVKGAYTGDVLSVVHKYKGICTRKREVIGMPQWEAAKGSPLTLITVQLNCGTGHFMLMERGKLFDNHTRKWVKASEHPNRNGRIKEAYLIEKKPRLRKSDQTEIALTQIQRQYYW